MSRSIGTRRAEQLLLNNQPFGEIAHLRATFSRELVRIGVHTYVEQIYRDVTFSNKAYGSS